MIQVRHHFARAQSRQLQPRAMVIFGIGIVGLPPRDDSPCAVAQTVADGAESKPCRGESRRKLHRLCQDFGGACKIAPRGMLEFWIDPASPYAKPIFQGDKKFIFHCAGGMRSALAAKTAQDMGLKPVAHLGGGFAAWRDAGGPVEKWEPKKAKG